MYAYAGNSPTNLADPFGLEIDTKEPVGPIIEATDSNVQIVSYMLWLMGMVAMSVNPGGAGAAATNASIRFAQKGISPIFRHGELQGLSIFEVSQGLRAGTISPNQHQSTSSFETV